MSKFIGLGGDICAPTFVNSNEIVKWDAETGRATLKDGSDVRMDSYDAQELFWGKPLPNFGQDYDLLEAFIADENFLEKRTVIKLFDIEGRKICIGLIAPRGTYVAYVQTGGYAVNVSGSIEHLYTPKVITNTDTKRASIYFLSSENVLKGEGFGRTLLETTVVGNSYSCFFDEFSSELYDHYSELLLRQDFEQEVKVA